VDVASRSIRVASPYGKDRAHPVYRIGPRSRFLWFHTGQAATLKELSDYELVHRHTRVVVYGLLVKGADLALADIVILVGP
jgi:hypothetical protein